MGLSSFRVPFGLTNGQAAYTEAGGERSSQIGNGEKGAPRSPENSQDFKP